MNPKRNVPLILKFLAGVALVSAGYACFEELNQGISPGKGRGRTRVFRELPSVYDAGPVDTGVVDTGVVDTGVDAGVDAGPTFSDNVAIAVNLDGGFGDGSVTQRIIADSDNAALEPATTTLSCCVWHKPQTGQTNKGILAKWGGSQNTVQLITRNLRGFRLSIATGLTDSSNHCENTTSLYSDGNWHLTCFRADLSQATNDAKLDVWVDNSDRTCTFTGSLPSSFTNGTAKWTMGEQGGASGYYAGKFDDGWCTNAYENTTEFQDYWNGGTGNVDARTIGLSGTFLFNLWHGDSDTHNVITNRVGAGGSVNFTSENTAAADWVSDVP